MNYQKHQEHQWELPQKLLEDEEWGEEREVLQDWTEEWHHSKHSLQLAQWVFIIQYRSVFY